MVRNTSPIRSILQYVTLALLVVLAASPRLAGAASTITTGLIAGSNTSTLSDINQEYYYQYGKPNQRRIWYNSAKNRWDAVVPKYDSNLTSSQSNHYILKDVLGSQTFTSVELEQRDHGRPDVFWDDANHELYVLGSHESVTQFWRLGYSPTTDTYSFQVGAQGVGVTVPGITDAYSNVPATLYVSPNGVVWVGVLNANGLQVQRSADGGATWMASPINLNPTALLGVTTWTHFQYGGTTYVGLFASENAINTSPVPTKVYFWYIPQEADPSVFGNWINDSVNIPPPIGTEYADDHVSAARDGNENLYFGVKTQWGQPTDPLIKLYKRTADGTWSQYTVTHTQDTPEQTRPSVVIDAVNSEIRVYMTDTYGGNGSYVQAKLDSLGDLVTAPRVVVFPKGTNAVFDDLISPRAPVNLTSNIAVIAHNTSTRTMWYSSEVISDTTPPTIAITSPTTAGTYNASNSSLDLTGTSTDGGGVTQVTWTNSLGGSGTASGTTSWTVNGITLQSGTNILTVTAWDAAGNTGTATLSVTYTPTIGDTTPPTVSIASPTSASTYSTSTSLLNLAGTATDNVGVTQVTWTNSLGGTGTASGTTSWTVNGITLESGINVLTVTAWDAAGNTGTATLSVTYTPPDIIVTSLIQGSNTSTLSDINSTYYQQYGKPNQHRIWYNSAKNRWDAVVPKYDSNLTYSQSNHYILTDVLGSQHFTNVELEQRDHGRPDIFWDDANEELYVLGSHESVTQFWRLGYNPTTDTYSFQVGGQGTGVTVPGITDAYSNVPETLYASPNGAVWVGTLNANGLQMQYSANGGTTWLAAPVVLNPTALVGVTTWIHFQYGGTTYVGLFASENGENATLTKVYFWYIPQGADPSVLANWTNDSANIPPPVGTEYADDHVSAARDSNENLYFAVKTQGGGPTDPLIKLYKRTPDGTWSQYTVTQTQAVPEQTRPSVVIDSLNGEIRVYTTDTLGGNGSYVKASLNALGNLATAPRVVVFPKGTNATFDDLISPRAPVNSTSNVAVIAHNTATRTMWFSSETIVNNTSP